MALLLTAFGCESATDAQADTGEAEQNGNKAALSDDLSRGSYLVGYDQARQMRDQTQGVLNMEAYVAGVQDAIAEADPQVPEAEAPQVLDALRAAVIAKQQEAQSEKEAGAQAFREAFAAEDGVTTTESGLMYQVLTAGEGPKPSETDQVVTHYHGTLIDGTVFDSSVERDQPAQFAVNGVIRGWTEALQLMGVGSKWKLVIPPELAYGPRGAGGAIGPNETLVFEVELLEIVSPES